MSFDAAHRAAVQGNGRCQGWHATQHGSAPSAGGAAQLTTSPAKLPTRGGVRAQARHNARKRDLEAGLNSIKAELSTNVKEDVHKLRQEISDFKGIKDDMRDLKHMMAAMMATVGQSSGLSPSDSQAAPVTPSPYGLRAASRTPSPVPKPVHVEVDDAAMGHRDMGLPASGSLGASTVFSAPTPPAAHGQSEASPPAGSSPGYVPEPAPIPSPSPSPNLVHRLTDLRSSTGVPPSTSPELSPILAAEPPSTLTEADARCTPCPSSAGDALGAKLGSPASLAPLAPQGQLVSNPALAVSDDTNATSSAFPPFTVSPARDDPRPAASASLGPSDFLSSSPGSSVSELVRILDQRLDQLMDLGDNQCQFQETVDRLALALGFGSMDEAPEDILDPESLMRLPATTIMSLMELAGCVVNCSLESQRDEVTPRQRHEFETVDAVPDLSDRMKPVVCPGGATVRCTTCSFNILAGEYHGEEYTACACGGLLCYECQEKGRPCRCRGGGERYKTKLCRLFANGCCNFGQRCMFAHGEDELRPFVARKGPRDRHEPGLHLQQVYPQSTCRNDGIHTHSFSDDDDDADGDWFWDPADEI